MNAYRVIAKRGDTVLFERTVIASTPMGAARRASYEAEGWRIRRV